MPTPIGPARIRLQKAIDGTPRLIRFLGTHMAFGLAVGVALASCMVLTNAAGLNDLLAGDGHPYLAMFMLYFMFGLTFASVAMGIAVMTMTGKERNAAGSDRDD